jgi:hypothetical protein
MTTSIHHRSHWVLKSESTRTLFCTLLALFTVLLGRPLNAQSGQQHLQKIVNFYQPKGKNLSFKVHYAQYQAGKKTPDDTISMWITRQGADFYLKGKDFEWLKNGNSILYVNHETEEIFLQSVNAEDEGDQGPKPDQLATLLKQEGLSFHSQMIDPGQRRLQINNPEDPSMQIDLSFDDRSGCLFKIVSQYSEAIELESSFLETGQKKVELDDQANAARTKVVATYTHYRLEKGVFPYAFKRYLNGKKGQYTTAKAFKNYTIVPLE